MAILTLGSGAGTGATVDLDGTDTDGVITLVTGTSPVAGGILLTFEFDQPFVFAATIQLTPANEKAAETFDCYFVSQNESSAAKFIIRAGASSMPANITLQFYYALVPGSVITQYLMGIPYIQSTIDSGNGDLVVAQKATLAVASTIETLSFYIETAAGLARLGIYDDTGPGGGPGGLLAEVAEFTPVTGWNTQNIISPIILPVDTYWLAYFPSSSSLAFRSTGGAAGNYAYQTLAYGPLPTTFSTTPTTGTDQWSFYAILHTL